MSFAMKLQSALNLVAAQAASAHGHGLGSTIHENFNLLRVGSPGTASLAVGMAHAVSVNDTLAANLTKLSHTLSHLLQGYVTSKHLNYSIVSLKTQVVIM